MVDYKKYIEEKINEVVENNSKIEVVRPPKEDMGDFSVAAFTLNISDLKNPMEKANAIKDKINVDTKYISNVTTIGPYINFELNKETINKETIEEIENKQEKYGSNNIGLNKELLIEHTSINPNASPHIGRARNSIIGDFLVRLYRFLDYKVETHYFINDIGKQISMLLVGAEKLGNMDSLNFDDMLKLYVDINEEAKTNEEINQKVFEYLNKLENGDEEIRTKFKKLTDICVEGQQKIFAQMDIHFDKFTHESDFVFGNITNDILEKIKEKGKLKEDENGRLYVDLEGYNIPTKSPVLVLTREDKTSLYPLRDIAFTIYKMNLNKENNFIVLGEDQETYMKQIAAVLDILGYNAPTLTSYSFVLLNGDKMATREGKVVLLEDFIEETKNKLRESFKDRNEVPNEETISSLAASCIKYNMLNVNRKKSVNFNLEEATNFQGDSAIYLIYNYARINSILSKAEINKNLEIKLTEEIETSLINDLYNFKEVIIDVTESKEAVVLTKYLYNLTQKFSKYYNNVNILKEEDETIRNSRLLLLESIKIVLENGMNILGIKPIKKM